MASNKRERELARMRAERQAARRAAAELRRRQRRNAILAGSAAAAVVAVILGVVLVAGIGDEKEKTPTGNTGGTVSCTYTKSGDAAKKVTGLPPGKDIRNSGTQTATLETSRGKVTATLLTSKAPCTVNSFAFLSQQGYFDKTSCHRLTTEGIYVLQCGDPLGSGLGGPGYQFPDENLKGATYPAGTLAMANSGPGTNGSQFFLVYKDTQLPASYTPFGTITGGLDVLTKIAAGGSDSSNGPGDGKPKLAVSLTKVTVS